MSGFATEYKAHKEKGRKGGEREIQAA